MTKQEYKEALEMELDSVNCELDGFEISKGNISAFISSDCRKRSLIDRKRRIENLLSSRMFA